MPTKPTPEQRNAMAAIRDMADQRFAEMLADGYLQLAFTCPECGNMNPMAAPNEEGTGLLTCLKPECMAEASVHRLEDESGRCVSYNIMWHLSGHCDMRFTTGVSSEEEASRQSFALFSHVADSVRDARDIRSKPAPYGSHIVN